MNGKDYKIYKNVNSSCLKEKKRSWCLSVCVLFFLAFSLSLENQYELMVLNIQNAFINYNHCLELHSSARGSARSWLCVLGEASADPGSALIPRAAHWQQPSPRDAQAPLMGAASICPGGGGRGTRHHLF